VKIGERGQITIPKKLRMRYGLDKHTDVDFIDEGDGIRIVKSERDEERFAQIRGIKTLKYAGTVDEYIEEIRGR
jgi:AbrB family looped-hinge helix DNA binding protein